MQTRSLSGGPRLFSSLSSTLPDLCHPTRLASNMPSTRTVIKSDPDEDIVMEESIDDEVVREIDIFLSPAMASRMYLMQFPLQHQQVPLPDAARIKQHHGMIELDESIPFNAGNDGLFHLEHRTHRSHTIPVSTHMAFGKMSDTGELHIVPLSHITQMRPSFSHVDETNDAEVPGNEEEKNEKKPVLFQKKETERAAMARKSSYAYKKSSEDSEPWQMLVVCGPDTIQHRQAKESLACPSPSTQLFSGDASAQEQDVNSAFVHSLNYLPSPVHDVDADVVPGSNLGHVCAQLTTSLQRGWPVPFCVLKSQFSTVEDQDLLTALSSCAVLVRGNFVLQSRLMPLTPALQQARTFILFLLQRMGHVERVRLEKIFHESEGVTLDGIQMLLEQVASRGLTGWRPKLEDNLDFYDFFPEQTQLHAQYWERQETRFADFLQLYNEVQLS